MPPFALTEEDLQAVRLTVSLRADHDKKDSNRIGCPVCGAQNLNYHIDRKGRQTVACLTPGCVDYIDGLDQEQAQRNLQGEGDRAKERVVREPPARHRRDKGRKGKHKSSWD